MNSLRAVTVTFISIFRLFQRRIIRTKQQFLLKHSLHKINCIHIKPTIWEYWVVWNKFSRPPPPSRHRRFAACPLPLIPPFCPGSRQSLISLMLLWTLSHFLEFYVNRIIQYVLLCVFFHSAVVLGSFVDQKFLILMRSNLSVCALKNVLKNSFKNSF